MKLIYRGSTYDYNCLKAASRAVQRETPYTLYYRGDTYQVTPKSKTDAAPVQTVTHQLIYRGNTHWVTRLVPGQAVNTPAQGCVAKTLVSRC